jgi:hypothetical protein
MRSFWIAVGVRRQKAEVLIRRGHRGANDANVVATLTKRVVHDLPVGREEGMG